MDYTCNICNKTVSKNTYHDYAMGVDSFGCVSMDAGVNSQLVYKYSLEDSEEAIPPNDLCKDSWIINRNIKD